MRIRTILVLLSVASPVFADGPGDNVAAKVRPIPPPGITVPKADQEALEASLAALHQAIEDARRELKGQPGRLELLPDAEIYYKAVHDALVYHEFFNPREISAAKNLVAEGLKRAESLRHGQAPWNEASGLVVRGYVSRIDGSVQPYGLVVPASYRPGTPHQFRLDAWFHGRGENLSEVNFIDGRQRSPGEFTPPNTFVLHPYGRYCNANKLAGEVDFFEALEHAKKHYPIDDNRIAVRGFSMGGAACWQFAVHYAGLWAAAAPGAGFAETADFLKVFQREELAPTAYEQQLWHLYDCTDYALNLYNCPTVAYSGEVDSQKQAADIMARALKAEGIELTHIIGPKTGHSYHPRAKEELNLRIDSIMARGRNPVPRRVRFTTWTLRYNKMLWVTVDGLDHHWSRARVDAEISGNTAVEVKTEGVSALTLSMDAGLCPLDATFKPTVVVDGQPLTAAPVQSDRSWTAHFRKKDNRWEVAASADDGTLRKRHGLQGPIDDAFMDSFLMVRPTGKPFHEKPGAWVNSEMEHAIDHWRRQFRGEARVKEDEAVTDADIAAHNLILWGDPQSNKVLAKIADKLPIKWNERACTVGQAKGIFPRSNPHVLAMIYPNPLNPKRYVVLNSGFTFREYDYLNNARQVPKLPDYAIFDVSVAATSRAPGRVIEAGFFDETWQFPE
jgi:hypothetical protein